MVIKKCDRFGDVKTELKAGRDFVIKICGLMNDEAIDDLKMEYLFEFCDVVEKFINGANNIAIKWENNETVIYFTNKEKGVNDEIIKEKKSNF